MSKTKMKLMMSVITMVVILQAGTAVLGYLSYVVLHYWIYECSTKGEWLVLSLAMGLPIMAIYFLYVMYKEMMNDCHRLRKMR
jgi:zinc transporter ZupT